MKRFNIRVYGILINAHNAVLVTDEYRMGRAITKFPGGGLEFGEGTIDCIRRELYEELNEEIEVISHFYTTDFFQVSAFNEEDQLISIYYRIKFRRDAAPPVKQKKFDFKEKREGEQTFRWILLRDLEPADFTFPVDRKVAEMLMKNTGIDGPYTGSRPEN